MNRTNTILLVLLMMLVYSTVATAALSINYDKLDERVAKVEAKQEEAPLQLEIINTEVEKPWNSIGDCRVTHYCSCSSCCGKCDGITATGVTVAEGRTIAVDKNVIPLGSEVLVNGHIYIAEDVGGAIKGNRVDIYVADHEEAKQLGTYTTEVLWR